jgi:hypothetical protein
VLKDAAQAVAWYRKAADQGYAMAQSNLGVATNGQGVPKDVVLAHVYAANIAAANGNEKK